MARRLGVCCGCVYKEGFREWFVVPSPCILNSNPSFIKANTPKLRLCRSTTTTTITIMAPVRSPQSLSYSSPLTHIFSFQMLYVPYGGSSRANLKRPMHGATPSSPTANMGGKGTSSGAPRSQCKSKLATGATEGATRTSGAQS